MLIYYLNAASRISKLVFYLKLLVFHELLQAFVCKGKFYVLILMLCLRIDPCQF